MCSTYAQGGGGTYSWVMKVNEDGETEWANVIQDGNSFQNEQLTYEVIESENESCIIIGKTTSENIRFATGLYVSTLRGYGFIVKYDRNGTVQFAKGKVWNGYSFDD